MSEASRPLTEPGNISSELRGNFENTENEGNEQNVLSDGGSEEVSGDGGRVFDGSVEGVGIDSMGNMHDGDVPGEERKGRGRPRRLNPDGTYMFPKRKAVSRQPRPPRDSDPNEPSVKRSVGRPRRLNPDGTYMYKRKSEGGGNGDSQHKPRSDWLKDRLTREEIFKSLREYNFAWLPTVQSLKTRFPGTYDKLGESTVRSWFEAGTRKLKPAVLRRLEKASESGADLDEETARIIVAGLSGVQSLFRHDDTLSLHVFDVHFSWRGREGPWFGDLRHGFSILRFSCKN